MIRDEAFDAIRRLIGEVRLIPEEGVLRVELRGELAGILALCDGGKKKPASLVKKQAEPIEVVAGRDFKQRLINSRARFGSRLFSNAGIECQALRDAPVGFTVLSAVGAVPAA